MLSVQIKVQQVLARLRNEQGEIGSQLILMAVLVAVAAFAVTQFDTPLRSLVSGIAGDLGGGGGGE